MYGMNKLYGLSNLGNMEDSGRMAIQVSDIRHRRIPPNAQLILDELASTIAMGTQNLLVVPVPLQSTDLDIQRELIAGNKRPKRKKNTKSSQNGDRIL